MRYFGEIKWFGGYNNKTQSHNDYGFITNIGDIKLDHHDIFFHKNEMLFSLDLIETGILVSFNIAIGSSNRVNATKVSLLENEKNEDLLERCLDSNFPMVWLSVLKNYSKLVPLDDYIKRLETKLSQTSLGTSIDIRKYIPQKYFIYSKNIRNLLSPDERISLCYQLLNIDSKNNFSKKEIIYELTELIDTYGITEKSLTENLNSHLFIEYSSLGSRISELKLLNYFIEKYYNDNIFDQKIFNILKNNKYQQTFLDLIPLDIIINDLWEKLPNEIKLDYFDKNADLANDVDQLIKILHGIPEKLRQKKLKQLDSNLKSNPKLFSFLHPVDKATQLSKKDHETIIFMWVNLDIKTKLFYLFRLVKYGNSIDFIEQLEEEHPLIRAVLKLIWVKDYESLKDKAFMQSHDLIQNYIVDIAWKSALSINLYPLLPSCPFGYVLYCEGKPWNPNNNESVFCPRKNSYCDFGYDKSSFKIYPNTDLPWEHWSLLEVLDMSNVTPQIASLYDSAQYVPKLSGWINRLNEIRERLKCTSCGKVMLSNFKYSKNLAAYNSTVFSCQCGDPTNQNVYLSHCWACRSIIDSRQGNHRIDGYYLCLQCGSGPQTSTSYTQGDICPMCGGTHMGSIDSYDKNFQCQTCNHIINLPQDFKLTGK